MTSTRAFVVVMLAYASGREPLVGWVSVGLLSIAFALAWDTRKS